MINISFDRPKLDPEIVTNLVIDADPIAIVDNEITLRVFLDDVVIPPIDIVDLSVAPISWTTGGDTITGVIDTFNEVRIGDAVTSTSGTDFASGQVVTDVSTDGASVTVSPVIDGDVDSGQAGSTLTFNPGTLDTTLYVLKLIHNIEEEKLTVNIEAGVFDGNKVAEGTVIDGSDNQTFDDGKRRKITPLLFNLDKYLCNARVDRQN